MRLAPFTRTKKLPSIFAVNRVAAVIYLCYVMAGSEPGRPEAPFYVAGLSYGAASTSAEIEALSAVRASTSVARAIH
jgi:hypothetical protein